MSGFAEKVGKAAEKKFDEVIKKVDPTNLTKASIDFRNETDSPIRVDMDNNRESHEIAPHGQGTFSEAHVGDAPTFRVKNADGQDAYSRRVNPISTPHSSLGWNGTTF